MSWRINEIDKITLVLARVCQGDAGALHCNASLNLIGSAVKRLN